MVAWQICSPAESRESCFESVIHQGGIGKANEAAKIARKLSDIDRMLLAVKTEIS